MTTEQVHTCSYYCDRPECLKAQRDELRDRLEGLDAEKGGEAKPHVRVGFIGHVDHGKTTLTAALTHIGRMEAKATPPAQAAEAVERVARAIFGNKWMSPRPDWETLHESTRDEYRRMARAAIGAMPAMPTTNPAPTDSKSVVEAVAREIDSCRDHHAHPGAFTMDRWAARLRAAVKG